jgi:hypothetical protein
MSGNSERVQQLCHICKAWLLAVNFNTLLWCHYESIAIGDLQQWEQLNNGYFNSYGFILMLLNSKLCNSRRLKAVLLQNTQICICTINKQYFSINACISHFFFIFIVRQLVHKCGNSSFEFWVPFFLYPSLERNNFSLHALYSQRSFIFCTHLLRELLNWSFVTQ